MDRVISKLEYSLGPSWFVYVAIGFMVFMTIAYLGNYFYAKKNTELTPLKKMLYLGYRDGSLVDQLNPWDYFVGVLLMNSLVAWLIGLFAPLMTVTKLILFDKQYSIMIFAKELYQTQDWFLFIALVAFGVVLPLMKFIALSNVWGWHKIDSKHMGRSIKFVDFISKWSMADVFVVAVALVIAKTSGVFADARVEAGLYFFACGSLGSMMCGYFLKKSVSKLQNAMA